MPRDFVDCDCYNLEKSLLNENVRFHRKTLIAKWTTKIYKNDRTALKLRWSLPLSYTILGLQRWFLIVSAQGFTARRWL